MSGMRSSIALTSRSWVNTSARSRTRWRVLRSEEHTSELQSLMRISYAVFCLKKKITQNLTPIPPNKHNLDQPHRLPRHATNTPCDQLSVAILAQHIEQTQ